MEKKAIVVGAGIMGLATARVLALRGYRVEVFERTDRAVGASIRNFGMVWPIGQPAGKAYDRAMRSRSVWKEIGSSGAFGFEESGSLHLARKPAEWTVLQELYEAFSKEGRKVSLLTPDQAAAASPAVVREGLLGALHSPDETIVDPREAIRAIPSWLSEKLGVQFHWERCVTNLESGRVRTANRDFDADLVVICSGADFETLFPEEFSRVALTKCKLQMMRLVAQPGGWRIGPSLCGGLSLIHYDSFKAAASLPKLRAEYEATMADYLRWGIHVMVSQNLAGELTVGDSHEYGLTHEPFDRRFINDMILEYLRGFAHFEDWTPLQSWNGIYPKFTDGSENLFLEVRPGVYIHNGIGGVGMTQSFGLAEELFGAF